MSDAAACEFKAYRITNLVSGKSYIGITRHGIDRRFREHVSVALRGGKRSALYAAIRAYGPQSFRIEHLCSARSWRAMVEAERALIDQHGTLTPGGYNLIRGVPQGKEDAPACFVRERKPMPQETREHLSRLFRGRAISEETKARRRETLALKRAFGLVKSQRGMKRSREFSRAKAKMTDVRYAGVTYDTINHAASAAGVTWHTFNRWVSVFGADVPALTAAQRYGLRHRCGVKNQGAA